MVNWKRMCRLFDWVGIIIAVILICGIFYLRHKRKLPSAHVGAMEANQPWIIVDPPIGIGPTFPYLDKQDLNILYLVKVSGKGEAIKINLKDRTISPYKFDVSNWEEVDKRAEPFLNGEPMYNPESPIWADFRGKIQTQETRHLYGYPWPNEPGMRQAVLRSGYWFVMDRRDGRNVELLRVKVQNAEIESGDLGHIEISHNGKWIAFFLSNINSRVFIFNREYAERETFK
jgi:hypothetical protein